MNEQEHVRCVAWQNQMLGCERSNCTESSRNVDWECFCFTGGGQICPEFGVDGFGNICGITNVRLFVIYEYTFSSSQK